MNPSSTLRQLQMQILWDRLLAVVEEQAQTLVRTAFSTTVREAGDLSAGVFDTRGRMLAQAVTGTPGHVNAMAASVGSFLGKFPLDHLQPGDDLVSELVGDALILMVRAVADLDDMPEVVVA